MPQKTLADFFIEESKRFDNIVYFSYPYSCCLDEACSYAKDFTYPRGALIERDEKETRIILKPLKGSRKRKNFVIRIWTP